MTGHLQSAYRKATQMVISRREAMIDCRSFARESLLRQRRERSVAGGVHFDAATSSAAAA